MDLAGPASHSYFSQRLRLHYADWGNAEKPPLILLHGGKDHCRNWDWVAQELREDWHIIAPDIRGHGDSQWSTDGNYAIMAMVTDLAQLIHQLDLSPVTIVAHSMGGNIALRYTGLYPDTVRRLVAIEGLGPGPDMLVEREKIGQLQRVRNSIEEKRNAAGRQMRRYATFEDALKRMQEENGHLSAKRARHLPTHAVIRNEDGSNSWKFDPYVQHWDSVDLQQSTFTNYGVTLPARPNCTMAMIAGRAIRRRTGESNILATMSRLKVSPMPGTGYTMTSLTSSLENYGLFYKLIKYTHPITLNVKNRWTHHIVM